MPFGLDRHGFKRKRYADIRADLERKWKESFGENSRTDEKSINGILISLIAYVASPIWMLAEKVYNNNFVHKSEGAALRDLVRNRLLEPRPAEKATGYIEITGDPETVIEQGFRVSEDVEYVTTRMVAIDDTGKVLAPIQADVAGSEGNAPPNTVTDIVTPLVGVNSVTNPEPISGGRDAETDDELKRRYELSLSAGGSPSANGIRAEVLGVEGVRTATVVENLSLETDESGRPGRSYETYVLGGNDEDIAKAIFSRRAAGTMPYGNIIVDVEDAAGNVVPVGFTRANEVDVYFEIDIETNNEFPQDGKQRIRTAIIEYVGGIDYDGNEYTGLQSGQDMYFTKIVSIIHRIPGVVNIPTLNIGTSPDDLQPMNTIEIDSTEVAMTDFEKVDIL